MASSFLKKVFRANYSTIIWILGIIFSISFDMLNGYRIADIIDQEIKEEDATFGKLS